MRLNTHTWYGPNGWHYRVEAPDGSCLVEAHVEPDRLGYADLDNEVRMTDERVPDALAKWEKVQEYLADTYVMRRRKEFS